VSAIASDHAAPGAANRSRAARDRAARRRLMAERDERLRNRILNNSFKCPETGCWIWLGRCNNWGYPVMTIRLPGGGTPTPVYAHRVAFEVFGGGRIRLGYQVDHICVNTFCVCPEHLQEVTGRQNLSYRGRQRSLRWVDYAGRAA
jgi:hypothetical protein